MSNFINFKLVGAQLFHADGWTDIHDEANSHFSDNFANAPKSSNFRPHSTYILYVGLSQNKERIVLQSTFSGWCLEPTWRALTVPYEIGF
jgi:hypothetical protein